MVQVPQFRGFLVRTPPGRPEWKTEVRVFDAPDAHRRALEQGASEAYHQWADHLKFWPLELEVENLSTGESWSAKVDMEIEPQFEIIEIARKGLSG
jgi:hypothetical protein